MPANRTEPKTYTIDDTIRVPVLLRDEEGVAHVRAIFRRMRHPGNLGPRGLDPDDTLELRGNGGGQKQATVETTLKVRDEHAPGDYICVAIQGYDSEGNMVMIKNPNPTRIFRVVDLGNKDDHKMEFLGWGEEQAPVPLHDHPPEYEPDTRRVRQVGRSLVTEDVGSQAEKIEKRSCQDEIPLLGATVGDFWSWAYSDLLSNTDRAVFAEFVVGTACIPTERARMRLLACAPESSQSGTTSARSSRLSPHLRLTTQPRSFRVVG